MWALLAMSSSFSCKFNSEEPREWPCGLIEAQDSFSVVYPCLLTLPETNISSGKWWLDRNTTFLLGRPIFRCYVSFRGCNRSSLHKQAHSCVAAPFQRTVPSVSLTNRRGAWRVRGQSHELGEPITKPITNSADKTWVQGGRKLVGAQ